MNEDKGAYLQDRGNSSLLRGFRNCRSYHRARFRNGISRLVHSRTYYVPDRICEIETNINEEIIERTNYINEDTMLHDEETEEISEEVKEFFEQNHLTRLDELSVNMDKREMITICAVAIRKYPLAVLQVIAQYIIELTRKGRRKHENNRSV